MASEPSPMCCCEYTNVHGQRSHIAAICCDCVELDNSVDQCLKGDSVSKENCGRVWQVVEDRIRIPWPNGARQIDLGVAIPPIVLLFSLHLASYQLVFTILVLVYLPIFVVVYYIYALRNRKRTWFFVSWGLSSVLGIYVLFMLCVAPFCSSMHTFAITAGFVMMLVCYIYVLISGRLLKKKSEKHLAEAKKDDLNCCFCTLGPFPRSKHCRICGQCSPKSDHHCIWTNCCIGQHNHRSFLTSIALFIVSGSWGIYLSLNTVCKSIDNSWRIDCTGVYDDPWYYNCIIGDGSKLNAMMFVACWYGVVFIVSMSGLLMQQLAFISFNITGDEWRRSSKHETCWQVFLTNPHNKGVLRNWAEFLMAVCKDEKLRKIQMA